MRLFSVLSLEGPLHNNLRYGSCALGTSVDRLGIDMVEVPDQFKWTTCIALEENDLFSTVRTGRGMTVGTVKTFPSHALRNCLLFLLSCPHVRHQTKCRC